MNRLILKNISSLEKIFPECECGFTDFNSASCLLNEEFSYQIAYKSTEYELLSAITTVEVESELSEYIAIYCTRAVPVTMSTFGKTDRHYLMTGSGMIPDVLEPYECCIALTSDLFRSLWICVKPDKRVKAGVYCIKIIFKCNGEVEGISEFKLEVIGEELPELDIPNTNWFYCDCIADAHSCEIFSEKHWELIDGYMKTAAEHGINMMLTPVITPALDTRIGTERPTVQLVDIFCENGRYSFEFGKLKRWLELCRKNGIKYIEVAHLFSQWGGEKSPKVEVLENGNVFNKFGWHTDALGDEYKEFIKQFVPALAQYFEKNWEKDKVYFHLTDEPSDMNLEHYGKLYKLVKPFIPGFKHMDAMSHYAFCENGFVDVPVVVTPSIRDFLGKGLPELWAYTCCGPSNDGYSNRFMAMPSYRNRILGLQMYKFNVNGFLHWGYNFYYSRLSVKPINPYLNNDSEGGFPAGDAFGVYPVPGGCIPSIRLKVFYNGLQDMMAAKLLEKLSDKSYVTELIECDGKLEFNICPENSEYILNIRERINQKIKELKST